MSAKLRKYVTAIMFSLSGHLILLGILFFISSNRLFLNLDKPVVQIHLAKLGKERDKKLLPRLDADLKKPKETVKKEKAVEKKKNKLIKKQKPRPKKNTTKKTANKKKPIKKKKEKEKNPLDVLKKRFGRPSDSGNMKGSETGRRLSSALEDSFILQVASLIKENYSLPAILSSQSGALVVLVRLRIDKKGQLLKAQIVTPSGESVFDNAVLGGVKAIDSFGVPPLQSQRSIAKEGILVEFRP